MPERIAAIVQARMSSSRLPGKVLMDVNGRTVLEMVLSRISMCTDLDECWVATSDAAEDDEIADLARRRGSPCFRGPLEDVLDRYRGAAAEARADAVVRITADCPFVDPTVVSRLVREWRRGGADYVTNTIEPLSFPNGLDAEVISRAALEAAASRAVDPLDREHVTTYLRGRPVAFRTLGLWLRPPLESARVCVDTAEDLATVRRVAEQVGHDPPLRDLLMALGSTEAFELVLGEPNSAVEAQPACE